MNLIVKIVFKFKVEPEAAAKLIKPTYSPWRGNRFDDDKLPPRVLRRKPFAKVVLGRAWRR